MKCGASRARPPGSSAGHVARTLDRTDTRASGPDPLPHKLPFHRRIVLWFRLLGSLSEPPPPTPRAPMTRGGLHYLLPASKGGSHHRARTLGSLATAHEKPENRTGACSGPWAPNLRRTGPCAAVANSLGPIHALPSANPTVAASAFCVHLRRGKGGACCVPRPMVQQVRLQESPSGS